MCKNCIEENKLLKNTDTDEVQDISELENCSLENLGIHCSDELINKCIEAEKVLSEQEKIEEKQIFSNKGELNDKVFNKFVLYTDLGRPCI